MTRGLALLAALLLAACAAPHGVGNSPATAAVPDEPSPGFRLPADARPLSADMVLDVDPDQEAFSGRATIRVQLDAPRRTVWLHARGLDVMDAMVAGRPARFAQVDGDGMARLALDAPVGPGVVDVQISWTAKFNPALESVYRAKFEDTWYAFTQFEAISARDAMPCFDEPRFKIPWTLSVTTKPGDVVVANTHVREQVRLEDGRTQTRFATTAPLPTYLVAFAVGPFDIVEGREAPATAERPAPVAVRGIAARGKGALLTASLDVTVEALLALERWFGIPYPYGKMDIVAVPDFAAGAMENAGLVTFRDMLLFVDGRSPLEVQKANIGVIVHELAHQWFGNLVTLEWWDDIWLNEAFASWLPTEIIEEMRPALRARTMARTELDAVTLEDSLVSARQIREPVDSKGDIENAFDGITYDKGASVIAMFEQWVGPAAFRDGVRSYLRAHAHGVATSQALLAALSAAAGRDVATPFSTFLEQPGVPYVHARVVCDAKVGAASLELAQERILPVGSSGDRNRTWQIPVCVRYDDGVALKTSCSLLTGPTGVLPLQTRRCPVAVHPNADGVGYYRWSLPAAQLQALAGALGRMSAGERISFGNAVRASFASGAVPFGDALEAAVALAGDEEPAVARTPLDLLGFAHDELVEEAVRPRVARRISALYRPILDQLGLLPAVEEDPRVRERRSMAVHALVMEAEDAATIQQLARLGRVALGLDAAGDKKIRLDEVPSDLALPAFIAAVKEGGTGAWEHAASRLGTETDSLTRRYLLTALGNVRDPALAARARMLSLDERLRKNEVFVPLRGQGGDVRTRDALWTWVLQNYDALLARLPEGWGDAAVASETSVFCSEEKAAEVEGFFLSHPSKSDALGRALAQAVEAIRLCAATKERHRESAQRVFAGR